MLSRSLKAAYYTLLHFPMRANALRHRLFARARDERRVHLGPGQGNYLQGWINVDANFVTARIDIWADISAKLPFQGASVDAFYSHHVIEHIADSRLGNHLADLFRCLKPGGVVRIGGPNGDSAIRKFQENDLAWFSNFPDQRESIGGRFANFILCRGEHLTILTSSYLAELAGKAGFVDVRFYKPATETGSPLIFDEQVLGREWESAPDCPHTLLMEARKPGPHKSRQLPSETDQIASERRYGAF